MAQQISRLVKQLEQKYDELSNKEADYLAASETRQWDLFSMSQPAQQFCTFTPTSIIYLISIWHLFCGQFFGVEEERDHARFRYLYQNWCDVEQLHHPQQEPFLILTIQMVKFTHDALHKDNWCSHSLFCFGYLLPIRNIRPSPAPSVKGHSDKDKKSGKNKSAKERKSKGGTPKADPSTEPKLKAKKRKTTKKD